MAHPFRRQRTVGDIVDMLNTCAEAAFKDGKFFTPAAIAELARILKETWEAERKFLIDHVIVK
jgi:hypothetical protein